MVSGMILIARLILVLFVSTAIDISPDEALAIERASCEADLMTFVRDGWHAVEGSEFAEGPHIEGMCAHLEAVTRGDITQLIINIPPGCMKSILCGVFWPAWEWARNPDIRWLHSSYSDALPVRDNMRLIRLIGSRWYQERWPHVQVTREAVKSMHISGGGWKIATGIGGLSTGEHPHRILLDDPHKVMEAESDAEIAGVIEYADGVLPSRGAGIGARTVLIMQRISQRDLSQHWLNQGGWEHLCLPMEFEGTRKSSVSVEWKDVRKVDGELLWPNFYTRPKVDVLKLRMGSLRWAGQYQQRPSPAGGSIFKREWFEIVDCIPAGEKIVKEVRAWDRAATVQSKANDPDYTASVRVARSARRVYYVTHVSRMRDTAFNVESAIKRMAGADGKRVVVLHPQDPGQAGKNQWQHMVGIMAGFIIKSVKERTSKVDRVTLVDESLSAQAEAGNVKIVRGPWNDAFLDELEVFPNGAHDDQVDALGNAFNECTKIGNTGASGG